MRILFITQWFQPEPLFKGVSFVKALMGKGHQVQVLTGFLIIREARYIQDTRSSSFKRTD
jgi:hypothetical protein